MISILKKIIIVSLAIIPSLIAFGQNGSKIKTNQIKFSPVRVIDLINPGIEVGYEKFYDKRYSAQFSVTYMTDLFKVTILGKHKGYMLSFEEKYYIKITNKKQTYLSAELVYLNVNYADVMSFIKDTALNTPRYSDTFKVAKQTFAFNLKYGFQIPMKRFSLDLSGGVGIKYKMVKRSEVNDVNAYEIRPRHPNIYDISHEAGNRIYPNLTMSIKLGYYF